MPQEHDLSAGVTLVLSGKDPQKRCLTGTVRSNEGDLVALIDIEAYVLEKDLRSIGL